MCFMKSIQDKLKERFDICYVLNLSSRNDRRIHMENQFKYLELEDINTSVWLRYHYSTLFKYNDIIIKAFNSTNKGRFTKPNEFGCAREHYSIVRECYERGFSHCLIMEDDIKFLKDKDKFIEFIDQIPEDFDIIQFGGFTADPRCVNILNMYNEGKYWVKHKECCIWNCSMYALSRKGMAFYLAFMDKFFWVADGPVYKAPLNDKLINTYICTLPLVIQLDKDIMASDIRDTQNDTINYKTQNIYESRVKKENYF